MKRFFILLFTFVLFTTISIADTLSLDTETASENDVCQMIDTLSELRLTMIRERLAANPVQPTDKDTYTFRNIPWNSTKPDAEKIMGLASSSIRNYAFEPLSLLTWSYIRGGSVDGDTGIDARYKDINVAGYKSTMYLEFIYPLEDGIIVRDPTLAQLYMAYYYIDDDDYQDLTLVYSDIERKLSEVYGPSIDATDNYHYIKKWSDSYGNSIYLTADKDDWYNVTIGYVASGAEERVEAMKTAVFDEVAQKEELERINNSNNVDGL